MEIKTLTPRQSLNKAYLRVKPTRSDIERFKTNLKSLFDEFSDFESEEHIKNDLGDFLKKTFYSPNFYINTKGRNDLVIHTGQSGKTTPGVLLEVKKPGKIGEMVQPASLNTKAFHELILYYLRERITNGNLEIKHLIATNVYEWYIFDATLFETIFAQNKSFVKQFSDFEEGRLAGKTTDFFYNSVAEPFISGITSEIAFTWFDFRDYYKPLQNDDKTDDAKLIALYKILSPEHLLKLPFSNDSNTLDKAFYSELLHIIGLTETKSGSKKLIERKKESDREPGSLIENTFLQLDSRDKMSRLTKPMQFGETHSERLVNVSLELVITWLNRILFLKLLEAQLIRYHKSDPEFGFLNTSKVDGYDDLDKLFFRVMARKPNERDLAMTQLFSNVPYLNSSLFEPTELEQVTIFISNLENDPQIRILSSTVLKDNTGKKRTGKLTSLRYLFEFLDAYDFAGEGSEEIQEENKTLINASVLGLIFEKLNGYKDGSFFTPGFITMYMCRETIRKAVLQKFKDAKGWNCEDFDDLYDKIEDRREANQIINSLKICDPAVGSGHFLVSALNEIIAIKSDLRILLDRDGRRLKECQVTVVNDELIVTDEDGELFGYNPASSESQRIQETFFHEKQTIIENCLFGVDINPNSVKICRLRLWIELLKNAYYIKPSPNQHISASAHLQTLPNIDINIKCGNSLVSRYALGVDIKQALQKSKWNIFSYRNAIMSYRNAENKEQKRDLEQLISIIKKDFQTWISQTDPDKRKRDKLINTRLTRFTGSFLFEPEADYGDQQNKEKIAEAQKKLDEEIERINRKIEDKLNSKIFENAFEWRFEFPEVLNDDGEFVGFDVVTGNPPYGVSLGKNEFDFFKEHYKVSNYQIDSYTLFFEASYKLLNNTGKLCFIAPSAWYGSKYDINFRKFLLLDCGQISITICPKNTFVEAVVETCIISLDKSNKDCNDIEIKDLKNFVINILNKSHITEKNSFIFFLFSRPAERELIIAIQQKSCKVEKFFDIGWGVKVYQKGKGLPPQDGTESDDKIFHCNSRLTETYKPLIGGSEIKSYTPTWKGEYLNYGNWLAEPRSTEWFEPVPRIIIREVTSKGKILAAFIDWECIFSNSVDIIKSKTNNLDETLQLLGILNSRFASYYHLRVSGNSQKDSFPKLLLQDLRSFPFISNIDFSLVSKVKQIISLKESNSFADTGILESEIDLLVYKLYGLTEDEIKIIEQSS